MAEEVFEFAEPWSTQGGVTTVRITRAEIIAHMRAIYVSTKLVSAIVSDDRLVEDFCALHWAHKVDVAQEKRKEEFLKALARLLKFADAGYATGLTWDGQAGVLADIGSDCQGIATDGEGWLELATNAIEKALAAKASNLPSSA